MLSFVIILGLIIYRDTKPIQYILVFMTLPALLIVFIMGCVVAGFETKMLVGILNAHIHDRNFMLKNYTGLILLGKCTTRII